MTFDQKCKQLEAKIIATYTIGTSLEDAEKLAAEFLSAMIMVSEELKKCDLDARMKKTGLKAIRAGVYIKNTLGVERKPTEKALESLIDTDEDCLESQNDFDIAEVEKSSLSRYYDVFMNAHLFYRSVAKGTFGA